MRVTQSMLQNNMLNNLFKSQSNMDKYLKQITTGKKINRPSDDPVIAMKGINYRTEVTEAEQYTRNATEVWNWFDHSDDVLGKSTKAMQRMEELANQAANGTNTQDELNSIKKEVEQLKEQMIEMANTQVNGKYIFNGTDTDKPLIKKEKNDNGEVEIEFNTGDGREEMVEIEVSKG
ncbi:MAG TPA: flagellar hook-associated protein FlgL, partial [Pseudogracilibacillus sp.]|nr:flagellar hook-associated protein FlgL [Pseudogracilibacillus sp.]